MPRLKLHSLVAAALGCLGAVDSLIVGYYVVSTSFKLTQFPQSESLIVLGYVAAVATGFSFLTLVGGSLLMLRSQRRRGATLNFAGGICLTSMYVYFAFFSQPILLSWLGVLGYSLVAPSFLSVIVSLLAR